VRRNVVLLLTSMFLSSTAALAGVTALGKQVYDLSERELLLGLLGLAEFLPALLLVLVTGAVADRLDRRLVAATAMWVEAAVALGLAAYAASDPTAVGPIFVLVVGYGIARAFVAPAGRSLPADIVPADRLPWLNARYSGSWQLALVVGPVLGGSLYAVDEALPYVAMAVLLALGGVCTAAIRLERPPRDRSGADPVPSGPENVMAEGAEELVVPPKTGWRDALEGFRFIRGHKLLLGAISLDLFAVLFGGAVALLPAIAEERLGVGAVGLGWLRAAGGIGAAITTAALAVRPLRHHVGRVLLAVVGVFGVFSIVLGATRTYWLAFVAMLVLSGADAVSVFIRSTLVPLVTPPEVRGRVLAVENVFIGASNQGGDFESGVAGEILGAGGAVVLGGVGTLVVAVAWWFLFPVLRDVDGFPDGSDP
jgi:MFS family permease